MANDPYKVLGVSRSATDADIRTQYRKLARKFHPDVNSDDTDAAEKFKTVNEAYQTLSDPEKKANYDRFGTTDPRVDHGFRAGRNVNFQDFFGGGNSQSINLESIFGGLGGRFGGQTQPSRGQNMEQAIELSLEEAFIGITKTILTSSGGNIPGRLEVKIPPGVNDKQRIRIPKKGGPGSNGGGAGDLFIVTRVRRHPKFRRSGNDLEIDLQVTPEDSVLGTVIEITNLQNKTLEVRIPPLTQNNTRIRLAGQGMPNSTGGFGDLLGNVVVTIPERVSPEEKRLYEQIRSLRTENQETL